METNTSFLIYKIKFMELDLGLNIISINSIDILSHYNIYELNTIEIPLDFHIFRKGNITFFGVITNFNYKQNEKGIIKCVNINIVGKSDNYVTKTINLTVTGQEQIEMYGLYYTYSDNFTKKVYQVVNEDYVIDLIEKEDYDLIEKSYYDFRLFLGLSLNKNYDDFEPEDISHISDVPLDSFPTKINVVYKYLLNYNYHYQEYYNDIKTKIEQLIGKYGYLIYVKYIPILFDQCYQGDTSLEVTLDLVYGFSKLIDSKICLIKKYITSFITNYEIYRFSFIISCPLIKNKIYTNDTMYFIYDRNTLDLHLNFIIEVI